MTTGPDAYAGACWCQPCDAERMSDGRGFKDSGVVNLYKPPGITSHQAVRVVQRILGASRAGHTGTLDPFAEGLLLVCLNEATRIAEYLSWLDKEYIASIELGRTTDTYDFTGETTEEADPSRISEEDVLRALERFRGEITQVPPMYSSIKLRGVPLYKLARRGIIVPREERTVVIHRLELLRYSKPEVLIRLRCSKGTYIRSLAHEIGRVLGVGAVLKALKRTAIGGFNEEGAASFEDLRRGDFRLYSMDEALSHVEELTLSGRQFRLARHGTAFFADSLMPDGCILRLKSPSGLFFAVGRVKDGRLVRVEKVFPGVLENIK